MGAKYSKPSGAIADVKELEYISALLQTERLELRKDGSIEGELKYYLAAASIILLSLLLLSPLISPTVWYSAVSSANRSFVLQRSVLIHFHVLSSHTRN